MIARLGDVATYVNGYAFKPSDWSDIGLPIIRIQDLTGNSYQANRYNGEYDKRYEIHDGDVLISWSASLGVYVWTGEKAVLNQHIFKVVFNKLEVDKSFFVHQVRNILENSVSQAHGATMKHLTKPVFDALPFNLPSVVEQQRISSVLDKLTDLISLRKQQLSKLDELVKARFVEMFGDPKVNPKGWKVIPLSEVINGTASNGFFAKRDEYCEDGNVQILGVVNIVNRMYSNIINLPKTNGTTVDIKKYQVKYGDMLFCRSSLVKEGIGKASIVPRDIPENILFECHVIRLPLNTSKCIPEFIQVLSTTPFFRNQIISQSKTATMTTISQDGILKSMIILPPIRLQQDFLNIVQKVDMSKLTIQQSLDKLEVLRKSLMQEYFG